jgi:hypothetical protein
MGVLLTILACLTCLRSVEAQFEVVDAGPDSIVQLDSDGVHLGNELAGSDTADNISHDRSCRCCGPQWTFEGDALFMQRARPGSSVLMFDTANPTNTLNANELSFDFEPGWEVSARRECDDVGLGIRFMSIAGWDAGSTLTVAAPPSLIQINNSLPLSMPGVTLLTASYSSDLLGFEFNRRRRANDWLTILAGFRYLELDERFHAEADAAVVASTYETVTTNRLYGGQLGAKANLWCRDRLTLEALGKVGVYHNDGSQFSRFDTGVVAATAADASERAAFVGELNVAGSYCLSDRLSLRVSYDLLWIESVVLATDQIPITNFALGNGITDGGVFYHGATAGLEYRR